MADAKLREGMEFMTAAEKARNKKTLFGKEKPDWDMAVQGYEAAATSFKNARAFDQACEAYVKASECHRHLDSLFLAAKSLDAAALLTTTHLSQPAHAADLYRQVSDLFLAQGSADRAGESLEKGAKVLEQADPTKSIEMYDESCKLYEEENKMRFGVDVFKRAIGVCVRNNRLPKALDLSTRLTTAFAKLDQKMNFHKQMLSSTVILLALGDVGEAARRLEMGMGQLGLASSEEGQIAQTLVQAFQDGDQPAIDSSLKRHPVQYLENEVEEEGFL
ncbi:soluble NSF attachment protein [Fimicolochytrium jonesii]|uniref:soluble NSF attachment protein n=1 Tax=Fimicolochytrium jonesii TaxID=1396493 RepID=UPI0022FE33C5|nr:soluble NSF attachment protein [Fimicolochytrium jonesii]KAI8818496.1 soluble NSF attachment protein [Fimicolochytrium jonesii]